MKRRNKQLLVENEYVKELLAVLKENPSPSGKDFAEMIAHVGELENRLAEAVEELKTMRQELQQVQNRSLKAVLQKSCKSLENNISNMRQKAGGVERSHYRRLPESSFGFQRARHFCPGWPFPVFPCQTHAGRDQESD